MALFENRNIVYPLPCPSAKNRMTSIDCRFGFIQFMIGDFRIVENIKFVQEVLVNVPTPDDTHLSLSLRKLNIPIIDCFSLMNKERTGSTYIILKAPWSDSNDLYAVAADDLWVDNLFYAYPGISAIPKIQIEFSEYIREYWETETEPIRFMNWPKMIK